MRLIDADALIEEAKEGHVDDFMYVYGLVNRQPTAFDIEKVLNKLEVLYDLVNPNQELAVLQAIDIVKKGGVKNEQR